MHILVADNSGSKMWPWYHKKWVIFIWSFEDKDFFK